jgi:hypothetical protein
MAQVVFGGMPAWLLEAYLVELGGRTDEGVVNGDGWQATLEARKPGRDAIGIGRVTVTIDGERASAVMEALRKKALRGGG